MTQEKKKGNGWKWAFWILFILVLLGVGSSNDDDLEWRITELEDRAVDYRIEIDELRSELDSCQLILNRGR